MCHGVLHSAASAELNLTTQYWTSRGVAVLDVNYGGSTGFGREYRESSSGNGAWLMSMTVSTPLFILWGGKMWTVSEWPLAAARRWIYRAGGPYVQGCFQGRASYFGVSDLERLLTGIHKFDAHSLVGLVGPYPLYRRRYIERYPINFSRYATCPVIFFQGLEDKRVPAVQSEEMFRTLREMGVPTAYLAFEGEEHGFQRAETIMRCLSAGYYFYSRVFGFEPVDDLEPVEIENLGPAISASG